MIASITVLEAATSVNDRKAKKRIDWNQRIFTESQ